MKKGIMILVIFAAVIGILFISKDKVSSFDGTWVSNEGDAIEICDGAKAACLGSVYLETKVDAEDVKVDKEAHEIYITVNGRTEVYRKFDSFNGLALCRIDPDTDDRVEGTELFYYQS